VAHLSDEQLTKLRLGGHDPNKVCAAFKAAVEHTGSPTVILARTIKGYGLSEAGEGRNITHQQKKLNQDELLEFRTRFGIPLSDEEAMSATFYRPPESSPELVYLRQHREQLGGFMPTRGVRCEPLTMPPDSVFDEFNAGSDGRDISTTMAFVRLLTKLLKDEDLGRLVVPIIPDEARTFGMESLFRQIGIYSHAGQLYEPVDANTLMYYHEAKDGQLLEEGILRGMYCIRPASQDSDDLRAHLFGSGAILNEALKAQELLAPRWSAPADPPRIVPAAPSVRRFAREVGIDIASVKGSGPGGRLSIDDVKAHARRLLESAPPASMTSAVPELPDFSRWGEVEVEAMTRVRRMTAENMSRAWLTAPQVTHNDLADITTLELLRQRYKGRVETTGGKLTPDEMQGGTFSISNLGGIGGTGFSPIVNWPEVAILGVSRGRLQPEWQDGQFEPRLTLPLSLSYDHRMVDGAQAARSLRWVAEALEQPLVLALEG